MGFLPLLGLFIMNPDSYFFGSDLIKMLKMLKTGTVFDTHYIGPICLLWSVVLWMVRKYQSNNMLCSGHRLILGYRVYLSRQGGTHPANYIKWYKRIRSARFWQVFSMLTNSLNRKNSFLLHESLKKCNDTYILVLRLAWIC